MFSRAFCSKIKIEVFNNNIEFCIIVTVRFDLTLHNSQQQMLAQILIWSESLWIMLSWIAHIWCLWSSKFCMENFQCPQTQWSDPPTSKLVSNFSTFQMINWWSCSCYMIKTCSFHICTCDDQGFGEALDSWDEASSHELSLSI